MPGEVALWKAAADRWAQQIGERLGVPVGEHVDSLLSTFWAPLVMGLLQDASGPELDEELQREVAQGFVRDLSHSRR